MTTAPVATVAVEPWRNRIVAEGDVPPAELIPNPENWRDHPAFQQEALEEAMNRVRGWVRRVLVNRLTGRIVDGHLRVFLALRRGEAVVPVEYVELTEEEERFVLATLDPLSALAMANRSKLGALQGAIQEDGKVAAMFKDLRRQVENSPEKEPPAEFPTPDENMNRECPKCAYKWKE